MSMLRASPYVQRFASKMTVRSTLSTLSSSASAHGCKLSRLGMKRSLLTERAGKLTITWYLVVGSEGAVQFMLMRTRHPHDLTYALDFGVHSRVPLYEGHEPFSEACEHIGGPCYYVPSFQTAKALLERFQVKQDPTIIWHELERTYGTLFSPTHNTQATKDK